MPAARRLYLRVIVKLLASVGLLAVAYVTFNGLFSSSVPGEQGPLLVVPLDAMEPGETRVVEWSSRQVLILWRTPEMLAALADESGLADPDSQRSRQPAAATNRHRSLIPELLVVIGHGTDTGCPVDWVAPGSRSTPQRPWPGGFRDRCRHSWYDTAGRVYRDQPANRNLPVPDYRLEKGPRLLLGEAV